MQSLDISILVPGMAFDGNTIYSKSLGGSETAGYYMARELAKLGHAVSLFCNCEKPGVYDKVIYRQAAQWQSYAMSTPHDVAIVQRHPQSFANRLQSRLNYLWCHDLALGRQSDGLRGTMWNVDKVFVVSDYMRQQYKDVYGLPDDAITVTRNGIETSIFPAYVPLEKRHRKRLFYAARPERGLDGLIPIFAKLLEKDPEVELRICGYDNRPAHMEDFYKMISEGLKPFGNKVKWIGHLSKKQLYREYSQGGLYIYPTPSPSAKSFSEVSCITAMEAMGAGLPFLSTDRGALKETLHSGAGTLLQGFPWEESYQEQFIGEILSYINDDEKWISASTTGFEHSKSLDWHEVAKEWTQNFMDEFAHVNDDPERLARHFYRRTDIMPMKELIRRNPDKISQSFKNRIAMEYSFTESEEALVEHYQVNGEATTARLSQLDFQSEHFDHTNEKRFQIIQNIFESVKPKRVLDYGCGHGWCDIYMSRRFPEMEFVGVDIDDGAVSQSRKFADKHSPDPSKLQFLNGNHKVDLSAYGPFDVILISEVLEHCINPTEVVESLEKYTHPDSRIVITVPYGPSEYWTPNWFNFRNHIWEFDLHDIRDLFGTKPDLLVDCSIDHTNEAVNEMCGFYLINYKADKQPLGKIDWDRKLSLQAPRRTLSASIIAGRGCEETLLWSLNSYLPVIDELVIVDTGLSETAHQLLSSYSAKIIKGSDPREHGFETPRNEGLNACTCDFVMWVDTDERVLQANLISKYMRPNMWYGYSIRQHNFAVDTSFTPDMPVRIFSRTKKDEEGNRMRFYGCIHEHPETQMNKGPGPVVILSDVEIAHMGYLIESSRRVKFWRNYPLLQMDIQKNPDRLLQKHFIMRDNCLLSMYELQQNGGHMTPEIEARCRETIELYRKHFLGKPGYLNVDSFQYYTQAMQILGEGVDVAVSMKVNRDDKGDAQAETLVGRFSNADEAIKEFSWRLGEKIKPLTPEFW